MDSGSCLESHSIKCYWRHFFFVTCNCKYVNWGHEGDHSPPSGAKVKNAWSCTSTFQIHLHGILLI